MHRVHFLTEQDQHQAAAQCVYNKNADQIVKVYVRCIVFTINRLSICYSSVKTYEYLETMRHFILLKMIIKQKIMEA